ncbi:helix-turn-helix transcriptional regulator [Plantactinospora sp. GCM10030261]|uniref:helix-turn-helix transcriptional regulator n=1 Tax=Plantactinospora sp. GCM10030261 TaxID=3273420 RepID=UPI00361990D0
MAEAAQRLLELLTLLGTRPSWSAPELANRLDVTTRTVRADVRRLRALGYPVRGERGGRGGYRLGAGGRLPPLLLDDEEAVAVAVGLRAGFGITGLAESSSRALKKLEQVLPARLRGRFDALGSTIERAPENTDTDAPDPQVPADRLRTIAAAIADRELLRFDYAMAVAEDHAEPVIPVLVEPRRLFHWQRRWYLVARDVDRDDWDAYRVDLMDLRMRTGRRVTEPASVPGGDMVAFLMRTVAITGWTVRARLHVHAPAVDVLDRIHPAVGVVEPRSSDSCDLFTGADSLDTIAAYVGMLRFDFTVESPAALVPLLQAVADRYQRAVDRSRADS